VQGLFSVAGKVALVTGGSRGIGAMIARGLAAGGARVYVASRDAARCEEVARELSKAGPGSGHALPADLASEEGVRALAVAFADREPALHVLVHDAARAHVAPLAEHRARDFEEIFALNATAAFLLVQQLLPRLEAAAAAGDPARVVNVGSADGIRVPALESYAYGASKAALHHLTRHLARRLARRGITVNAIAPGSFATDMLRPVLERYGESQVVEAAPLARLGTPEDAVGAVLFLASRAGAFVTGAILPVDGGLSLPFSRAGRS
jgi:NAD(P)-dependent dehydrogenase (short-subunit alcohol dehydrogenase family)